MADGDAGLDEAARLDDWFARRWQTGSARLAMQWVVPLSEDGQESMNTRYRALVPCHTLGGWLISGVVCTVTNCDTVPPVRTACATDACAPDGYCQGTCNPGWWEPTAKLDGHCMWQCNCDGLRPWHLVSCWRCYRWRPPLAEEPAARRRKRIKAPELRARIERARSE